MKYIQIQKDLEKLKVFSSEDLKILDDKYDRSKVLKWKKSGYIKQIIKWFYLCSSEKINQNILYYISNRIYSPSYISLETAFNYYGLIPEQVFSIIGVSTKKTIDFDTDMGFFSYKKIKPSLFWWYTIVKLWENKILLAELEKAILDYFYSKSNIKDDADIEWLRWNKDILREKLDREKLESYTNLFWSKAVEKKVKLLLHYMAHDTNWIY